MNQKTYKSLEIYFSVVFIVLSAGSFISVSAGYNIFPGDLVFEFLVFSAFGLFACIGSLRVSGMVIGGALLTKVIVSFGFFAHSEYHDYLVQFVIVNKFIIYLALLWTFRGNHFFRIAFVRNLFYFLLFVFAAKYSLIHILDISYLGDGTVRPGVFVENNYEVIFLLLLFYALNQRVGFDLRSFLALCTVVLLSGSKSGALGLGVLVIFGRLGVYERWRLTFYCLVIGVFSAVFLARSSNFDLSSIDRYVFFLYFLNDINNLEAFQIIFGPLGLEPVSAFTSSGLIFYRDLFADFGKQIAFSVLYHSFIMRLVYDHGLFGLFLFVMSIVFVGISAKYCKKGAFGALSLLMISGLSVSSINSPVIMLGFMFFVFSGRNISKANYVKTDSLV